MDQTRKAFVMLTAAISAGNLAACNSDDDTTGTANHDAAADTADATASSVADTKQIVADTAADALVADTTADTLPPDSAPLDTTTVDQGAVTDLGQERVVLNEDASRPAQPDTSLAMPAGTIYDVVMKEDCI